MSFHRLRGTLWLRGWYHRRFLFGWQLDASRYIQREFDAGRSVGFPAGTKTKMKRGVVIP